MGERSLEAKHRWCGRIDGVAIGDRVWVRRGGVGAFGGHFLLRGGKDKGPMVGKKGYVTGENEGRVERVASLAESLSISVSWRYERPS
jgi:hypothetical protein